MTGDHYLDMARYSLTSLLHHSSKRSYNPVQDFSPIVVCPYCGKELDTERILSGGQPIMDWEVDDYDEYCLHMYYTVKCHHCRNRFNAMFDLKGWTETARMPE